MGYKRYHRCNCERCNGNRRQEEDCEPVIKEEYDCGADRCVKKYQHIVKHRHDVVNEYDVVHEHEYNYYDVVTNREVVRHCHHNTHKPDYCCEMYNCPCED